MHAEDVELTPTIVMRDNDVKYREEFDQVFESAGAEIKRNAYRAPNLRAHVERFIQTLKHECLDKFVIVARQLMLAVENEHLPEFVRCPESARETFGDLVSDRHMGGVQGPESRTISGSSDASCVAVSA